MKTYRELYNYVNDENTRLHRKLMNYAEENGNLKAEVELQKKVINERNERIDILEEEISKLQDEVADLIDRYNEKF